VALDRQRLAGELVDDVQELQDLAIGGLVELKVDRPHVIGVPGRQALGRDGRSPQAPALSAAHGHAQALLAPQALHALAVHAPAFLAERRVRSAVAPSRALAGELSQLVTQRFVVLRTTRLTPPG
jgi:hypothetical protein